LATAKNRIAVAAPPQLSDGSGDLPQGRGLFLRPVTGETAFQTGERGLCGCFRFWLLLPVQKKNTNPVSLEPGQFAPTVRKPGGGQQKKKLLQLQALNRPLDHELGAAFGDVLHDAVTPPSAVDAHHLRLMAAFKHNPMICSLVCHSLPVKYKPEALLLLHRRLTSDHCDRIGWQ
jgi:hypothetical protein